MWVRGRLADGAKLWDKIKDQPGVVGLLPGDRDIAIRMTAAARPAALQAQVRFALADEAAQVRVPVAGQRWWRLGPLTEAECWRVKDLILAVGLSPLRDEVRLAKAGPFRNFAYFASVGEPICTTLDDCTWNSSEARLTSASPPPRRPAPSVSAQRGPSSTSLPAQAQWGGARRSPAQPSQQPQRSLMPQPAAFPAAPPASLSGPPLPSGPRLPLSSPAPSRGQSSSQPSVPPATSRRRGRRGSLTQPPTMSTRARDPTPARPDRLDQLIDQVAELGRQNAAMLAQLQSLQRENADLRQQLAQARGLQSHQPYSTLGAPPPSVPLSQPYAPLPASSQLSVPAPQLQHPHGPSPASVDHEMTLSDSPRSPSGAVGVDNIDSHGLGHGLF